MFARPSTGPEALGATASASRRSMPRCSRARWRRSSRFALLIPEYVSSQKVRVGYSRGEEESVGKGVGAALASVERRYRELAGELAGIGYIASGSLAQRYTRCGKPTCRCRADPPRLHGPYWHWSAKVEGRTLNRRLTEREARLYLEWIANDRKA